MRVFKITVMAIILAALAFAMAACASTGGLPSFGADIGMKSSPLGDVRAPYTDMVSYFGYVKPGSAPDATINSKKMYFLYVWIPVVAPEIGIRMVSPVPAGLEPKEADFVAANYAEGKADTANFFDTWVTLERATDVLNPADIASKGKTTKWISYGSNDDSSELPANPAGNKYNSVLRVTSEASNPLKALVRGLYRIGFTSYKPGEVQGTFIAQVGAPVKIPNVQIAKTLDELAKAAK